MPKNHIPSDELVKLFVEFIDKYAADGRGKSSADRDVRSCDLQDLDRIFSAFESGDQWEANGLVYRMFKGVRKNIPEAVLKFIFKHS